MEKKVEKGSQMTLGEAAAASTLVMAFAIGLLCFYLTVPDSDYTFLKLPLVPSNISDSSEMNLRSIREYTAQVLVGYCMVYICMQTLMIPGTVFLSLLAGALFGVLKGLVPVMCTATAGASSRYFLSKLIGRHIVLPLWPGKLKLFQNQVAKRRENLLNYMLFLRLTPTLPHTFINVASPIVDVPFHVFFLRTFIGLMPAAFVTIRDRTPTKQTTMCSCHRLVYCPHEETLETNKIYRTTIGIYYLAALYCSSE